MTSRGHPSVDERFQIGKSLRNRASRTSHAELRPKAPRPDPIGLLEEQNRSRLDWLVPVRRARMMASPFAFYRGGARIMAADLQRTPVTGLTVQACGDAHLANFGLFASPERELIFGLNDFDEKWRVATNGLHEVHGKVGDFLRIEDGEIHGGALLELEGLELKQSSTFCRVALDQEIPSERASLDEILIERR